MFFMTKNSLHRKHNIVFPLRSEYKMKNDYKYNMANPALFGIGIMMRCIKFNIDFTFIHYI